MGRLLASVHALSADSHSPSYHGLFFPRITRVCQGLLIGLNLAPDIAVALVAGRLFSILHAFGFSKLAQEGLMVALKCFRMSLYVASLSCTRPAGSPPVTSVPSLAEQIPGN